jgi:hypothetical protein
MVNCWRQRQLALPVEEFDIDLQRHRIRPSHAEGSLMAAKAHRYNWICDACSQAFVAHGGGWSLPSGWTSHLVNLDALSDGPAIVKTAAVVHLCPDCSHDHAAAVSSWLDRQKSTPDPELIKRYFCPQKHSSN